MRQEQWEKECADLRAELVALQNKLQVLEAHQVGDHVNAPTLSRWRSSKRIRLVVLPVVVLLAAGGALYGKDAKDALFIDEDGNVGIGTTAPHATLDVEGVIKARTAIQGPMLGARKITETKEIRSIENKPYVEKITPDSDGFVIGLLDIVSTTGDARCWIEGEIPDYEGDSGGVMAKSWIEVKPGDPVTGMTTSFTMPVKKADTLVEVRYGCIPGQKPVKSIQATIYWIPLGG